MTILYVILGAIALFFLLQFGMVWKMRLKKGKPAPELGGRFKGNGKKLFYFYSPSCGACKPMTPVIEKLKKKNRNVFKVNIANDMATARKFGVMGTPSTVLVDEGVIREFLVGPQPEDKIRALIQ